MWKRVNKKLKKNKERKRNLEKILEKKIEQVHLQITAREDLDRLDDIRLAKNEVLT